jgi:hypothetical protein
MRTALLASSLPILLLLGGLASAKGPAVYPLSEVKAGQKGYGLTVFSGFEPERFSFEVIGVVRNFLPKLDIILVKSDDPKLQVSGFAQGMSGSPLYLDGKVLCAFSYGFRFNKIAMGGCTPVESMIAEARAQPSRSQDTIIKASLDPAGPRYQPLAAIAERPAPGAKGWMFGPPLPAAPIPQGEEGLTRAAVPLGLGGMGSWAFNRAKEVFAPMGLEPMAGGGSGNENIGPTSFVMGGSIGIALIKGDTSATATGTVSYIDGSDILAFGHPMFQTGQTWMPATGAEIHYVVPSAQSAFKMASPTRTLGVLVNDRQSHIEVDTKGRADLLPVDLTVILAAQKGKGPTKLTFHSEVARNRFLTGQLVMMAIGNGVQLVLPDTADCVATVRSSLTVKGYEPLTFVDYAFANDGAAGAVTGARALRIVGPLLFNPWTPVRLERVAIEVEVTYGDNMAAINELRAPGAEVPAGKPFDLEIGLNPYLGKPTTMRIPVTLPARLAGQVVKIDVFPGDTAKLDVAAPQNLDQLMAALRKVYPGNVLVVTVTSADDGVSLDGVQLPNLPDSAIDSVRPGAASKGGDMYKVLVRQAVPTARVLQGHAELTLKVRDAR